LAYIYLDHSATTLPSAATLAKYQEDLLELSGNPASLHPLGVRAAQAIRASKERIAGALQARPDEVILTSGGSEAINTALKGYVAANSRRGRTIVTLEGEHAATRESLAFLSRQGYTIRTVPLTADGKADLEALAQAVDADTLLVTCLLVNNETGVVQPVESIVRLVREKQPLAAIHLDAVQACGKIPVRFASLGVDLLSGSGHKTGAPKGIGWLLIRRGLRLEPLIHGGGQQQGLRSGTENAPLAVCLADCLTQAVAAQEAGAAICDQLRSWLLTELNRQAVDFVRLSPLDAIPQILCLAFPGLRGETLLHALEKEDILVSTGAACSSHKKRPSPVLTAMGVPQDLAACSIRISLAATNTPDEITAVAAAIARACKKYRR
jgi:cysteine desulfurase